MEYRLYPAHIIEVVDGDSVRLDVDVGFLMGFKDNFRMYGINAPEGRYTEASSRLYELLPVGMKVTILTYKREKYGRWMCDIFLPDGRCVNEMLVDEGLATPYFGGKR